MSYTFKYDTNDLVNLEVSFNVNPGEKAVLWGDNATPGAPAEIENLEVCAEVWTIQGKIWAYITPSLHDDVIEEIKTACWEYAGNYEQDAKEAAAEFKADCTRDDARCGE